MSHPRFTQTNHVAAMTCRVQANIEASADVIWSLLTDADDFPRWNSTIARIEGRIAEGERLRLHVPGTTRTFTPRVSGVVPGRRMIWSDGVAPLFKGVRTFILEPQGDGSTDFVMEERFSGVIFAVFKTKMPNFRPIFESFARDLALAAEDLARESEARISADVSPDFAHAVSLAS